MTQKHFVENDSQSQKSKVEKNYDCKNFCQNKSIVITYYIMSLSFQDQDHHFISLSIFFFKNRIFHDQKFFEFFSQKFFPNNFWGKVHKTLLFSGLLDYPIFQPKFFESFLLFFSIRKTLKTD